MKKNYKQHWHVSLFSTVIISMLFSCGEEDDIMLNTLHADAGIDQEVRFGEMVTLDGSNSYDEMDRTISYLWELTSTPEGSNPEISGATTPIASFEPDAVGEYQIKLTVSTEFEQKTDAVSVMVDAQFVEIGGILEGVTEEWDKTTPAGMVDYRVVSILNLRNSNITVKPGVIIEFTNNTSLFINDNSSFDATGTEEEPIVLKGMESERGYWGGVRVNTGSGNNKLIHAKISDGGQGSGNDEGMISFGPGGRLILENSRIENSSTNGLIVSTVTNREIAGLTHSNNVYKGNRHPVSMRANYFHYLDSDSDYSENENDLIYSEGRNSRFGGNLTWQKLNVPYFTGQFQVDDHLTIAAGAEVRMGDGEKILVANNGRLSVLGTEEDPAIISGYEKDLKGYWRGIEIKTNSNNEIRHAEINGAGSGAMRAGRPSTSILVDGGRLNIENSLIKNSGGYGIHVYQSGDILEENNNRFENIDNNNIGFR